MPRSLILSIAVISLALPAMPQQIEMTGPISGFVFDQPSRSLRQVAGLPGAARLSDALLENIDWATIAPDGHAALLTRDTETRLLLLKSANHDPEGLPINGLLASPALAAWSPDSSAVALYSPSTQEFQWLRLTTHGPIADPPISAPSLPAIAASLVASAPSGPIFAAVPEAGIYRITDSHSAELLLELPAVSALALSNTGQTLWAADSAAARIIEIASPAGEASPRTIFQDEEKLAAVSALAASPDARHLYIAARRLYVVERTSESLPEGLELDTPATALAQLGHPSVLTLGQREKKGDPLYVLDLKALPGLFFVPAGDGRQ